MSDDIKEIRKHNLRKIIDDQYNGSVNAFAKHIKRPPGFFYDAFADKRPLGERVMRSIEAELGLLPHELDKEDATNFQAKKFELINVYSTQLSASNGNEIFDEEIIDQTPINMGLMIQNGWKKENLCCFVVCGDSMEPTLHNGSRVLVDTSKHEIIDNKIYALRNGSQIFIKRLYKVFNQQKVIAKSDNSLYPEIQIDLSSENADLKIVGQAVLRLEEAL
ncbi:MAG: hypothetical protein E6Q89_00310 [Bacteroidia bacterium]|nr:MAG: hypothetical protein E6Q89_00310 [Bacteroidia bacterium]